jgi:hypothetical protein
MVVVITMFATAVTRAESAPPAALPLVAVVASSEQAASKAAGHLIDGSGLAELSGVWAHSNDTFRDRGVERGTMWSSGALADGLDLKAVLTFDLGAARRVGSFHVWNYNEPGFTGTGCKDVEVLVSRDGLQFDPVGRALLRQAGGTPDEEGQRVSLARAVEARFIRLHCLNNWQGFDRVGLSEVRFHSDGDGQDGAIAPGVEPVLRDGPMPNVPNPPRPAVSGAENIIFPNSAGVIDVTGAPYFAKGDGIADDTRAIQRALNDYPAQGAVIYLPNGTYRISRTLHWPMGRNEGQRQKLTSLQGQSRAGVVIRLTDQCPGFQDPAQPRETVNTGGGPAQRFFNSIRNCTFDTGRGNPGAIGVRFNASNCGVMRDVDIRSGDGAGVIGLDQSYADDFGPCLVKNVSVTGFDTGIAVAHGVNGIVYEHITLRNQNRVGWENRGMPISIRGLRSDNQAPVLRNVEWYGLVTLLDAELIGRGSASNVAAIERLAGGLFLRNIRVSGFAHVLRSERKDQPAELLTGPRVEE